jgi:protein-S-isoprenylcysteine O-methyltransferase Ste14
LEVLAINRFEKYRNAGMWIVGITLFIVLFLSNPPARGSALYEAAEIIGYVLVTLAVLGTTWCAIYMAGHKNMELIQDGPYSICRNPSYIVSFIGLVGVLIGAHNLVVLIVAPLYWVYYFFVIRSEEKRLLSLFKDEFTGYRSRVHRFLPNLRNYWSRDVIEVNSYLVLRAIIRAGFFMWVLLLLKILEHLKTIEVNGNILIPALWNMSF